MDAQQIANTILQQLGGRQFITMTGAKNFLFADITDTCPNVWLRMDVGRNAAGINRLKITLMPDDTYTMHFYRQQIKRHVDVVIDKEQTFEGVYDDMLRSIFTKVTGMYTSLGSAFNRVAA